MKKITCKSVKYAIIALHILLTLFFSKIVLRNIGYSVSGTKIVNNIVSVKTETVIAFIFSELFSILLVFCIWNLVFFLIQNFKRDYIPFIIIYVCGVLFLFLIWPEGFTNRRMHMEDNLTTFATAIRLMPDYWHSFYSSIVYAACMFVLPFRFSISFFQWSFFFFSFSYIFFKAGKYSKKKRYLLFAVFCFPNALEFITYSHRVCMYMIAISIYIAIIVFDMLEKRKRTIPELIGIAFLAAFLSIWRTEGIIVGLLSYVAYLLFIIGHDYKREIKQFVIYVAFFVLLIVPQKIGDIKYYGDDYKLMNSFDTLQWIFNSDKAQLSYEGAEDDLRKIEAVVPIRLIKYYSTEGYRSYNVNVRGNSDINQSAVDKVTAEEYSRAYHNIIKHNLLLTAEIKTNLLLQTFGLKKDSDLLKVNEERPALEEWSYVGWDVGYGEYYTDFMMKWRYVPFKFQFAERVYRFAKEYFDFTLETGIYGLTALIMVLANIYISVRGIVELITRKKGFRATLGIVALINLMSFGAISIVMPAPAYLYFFPTFCIMTLMLYLYIVCRQKSGKRMLDKD